MATETGQAVRVEVVERSNRDELDDLERQHKRSLTALAEKLARANVEADKLRRKLASLQQEKQALTQRVAEHRREVIEARANTRHYFMEAKRLGEALEAAQKAAEATRSASRWNTPRKATAAHESFSSSWKILLSSSEANPISP